MGDTSTATIEVYGRSAGTRPHDVTAALHDASGATLVRPTALVKPIDPRTWQIAFTWSTADLRPAGCVFQVYAPAGHAGDGAARAVPLEIVASH